MAQAKYDLESPEFFLDPYPTYRQMRENDPIYPHPPDPSQAGNVFTAGTCWYITRYEDSKTVLRDHRRFVHDFKMAMPPEALAAMPPMPPLMGALGANLIGTEPPEHTKLRALVSKGFSPRRVDEMDTLVASISEELLDGVVDRGEMDLIEEFAFPLPITVITGLMGLPLDDSPLLRKWAEIKPPRNPGEVEAVMKGLGEAKAYIDAQLAARRSNPTDDLITGLMEAEIEGEALDEMHVFSMIMMFVAAGFETTVNLIGNGMLALLDHPDQLEMLRQDPSLAKGAVEEMLRYDSPLEHALMRWVAEDVELGGQALKRGDRIVVVQASANRDPEQFADADRFDIAREDNKHLAFGHGVHYCLGAPLARLEAPIAFEALLRRLPDLRMKGERSAITWRQDHLPFRGVRHLPLTWTS